MAARQVTGYAASRGFRRARLRQRSFSWARPSSRWQSCVMVSEGSAMPLIIACFGCGLIFGAGLFISGMTQPEKVLGFLDIFGAWDATLALVMAGAVAVSAAGFALARRRGAPVLATTYHWPTRSDIDAPLVMGAVLFGTGWGLVGICPG